MLGLCLLAECLLPLPETQQGTLTQQPMLGREGAETAPLIGCTRSYSLTLYLQGFGRMAGTNIVRRGARGGEGGAGDARNTGHAPRTGNGAQ